MTGLPRKGDAQCNRIDDLIENICCLGKACGRCNILIADVGEVRTIQGICKCYLSRKRSRIIIRKIIQIHAADELRSRPCKCDGSCIGRIAIVIIGPARIGIAAVVCDTVYNRAKIVRSGCTVFRQRCRRCYIGALGIDCLCHTDGTGYRQRFLPENSHCAVNGHNIALCCKLVCADGIPCNRKFTAEGAVCQHTIHRIRQCGQAAGHGYSGNIAHGNDIGNDMQLGGNGNILQTAELQRALDGIVACCVIGICCNILPCDGAFYGAAIRKRTGSFGLQCGLRSRLHGVVTHHGVADKTFLRVFGNGCGGNRYAAAGQVGRRCGNGKSACFLGGAHNNQCLACICRNVGRGGAGKYGGLLILGSGCLIAVVHAHNFAIAAQGEVDGIGSCSIQIAVSIGDIHRNVCQAAAVRLNLSLVGLNLQFADSIRCGNRSIAAGLGNFCAVFVICLGGNGAFFICNIECRIQAAGAGCADCRADTAVIARCRICIVDMSGISTTYCTCCGANQCTIAVQLHCRCIGINDNRGLAAAGQHVITIPCRYQMQGGVILFPLAAIEIIGILFKARSVYNAKIGAVRDTSSAAVAAAGTVPWSRLTKIVPAGPYELTCDIILRHRIPDGIMCRHAPADF